MRYTVIFPAPIQECVAIHVKVVCEREDARNKALCKMQAEGLVIPFEWVRNAQVTEDADQGVTVLA